MVNFTQPFELHSGESLEGSTVVTVGPTIFASTSVGQAQTGSLIKFQINASGQVARDGSADTTTSLVKELYYHNHTVFQRNTLNEWFYWDNSIPSWLGAVSPKQLWDKNQSNVALLPFTADELTATATLVTTDQTTYGVKAVSPGLLTGLYWEASMNMIDEGHPNIGIGTPNNLTTNGEWLGVDINSIGWHPSGDIFHDYLANGLPTGEIWPIFHSNERLCMAINTFNWMFFGRVGNGPWNANPAADPITGDGGFPIPPQMQQQSIVPGASLWTTGDNVTGFFERSSWRSAAPAGFSSWSEAVVTPPSQLHYGTTPPATIANVRGNLSPIGWPIELFDDFTSFTESATDFTVNTGSATWWQGISLFFFSQYQEVAVSRSALTLAGIAGASVPFLQGGRNPFSLRNGTILQLTAFPATVAEINALRTLGEPYGYGAVPVLVQGGLPGILTGALTSELAAPTSAADALTKGYKRYGYWEINCKYPHGFNGDASGLWSMFYLTSNVSGFLPRVDMFSQDGEPTIFHSFFSWDSSTPDPRTDSFALGSFNIDFSEGFHTFGFLWVPNYLAMYVDGRLIGSYQPPLPIPATGSATSALETTGTLGDGFLGPNSPMCMTMQLSCGWQWEGGHFVTASQLPATFEIDWIRYSALGPL